jgi:hypothetical protein
VIANSGVSAKYLPMTAVATEWLACNTPDTVRGTMYGVVSAGFLPDTGKKSYTTIQEILGRLRENGTIPFQWIVDTVRQTIKPSSWSGLEDFADTVRDAYRKDFWASLPEYILFIVEKDTVAGKVSPVTREYDVPLHPIRGYSSKSYAWNIAQAWKEIEKPIFIYYIGDHDPSGRDLERSMRERLTRYSQDHPFTWRRLGVLPEQFERFDMIPLAPKKGDKRYKKFSAEFGDKCAEVEAIPANDLREMVRDAIESHIPKGQWERLKKIEDLERQQWTNVMAHFGKGSGE